MRLVAAGAGALALIGLLLYLQARQRSQIVSSMLARRMALTRPAQIRSLWLEVVTLLALAAVVGGGIAIAGSAPIVSRIDPLPNDLPAPRLTIPTLEIALIVAGLLLFALAAAALTQWRADRADVSEALRAN
jgi:putative ABC transport system permease protein